MTVLNMTDLDLANQRVLIREDLNVPVKDGVVQSDARIVAALPTIRLALEKGAAVMVCSHLGRPEEGQFSEENSLAPVAAYLSQALGREVPLVRDYLDGVDVAPGEIVLLENVRFNSGEKKNTDELAKKYAALCDVFVMDAFGTAHRAQGSTHGVAKFAKKPVRVLYCQPSWRRWVKLWMHLRSQWLLLLPARKYPLNWMCSPVCLISVIS